LSPSSQPAFAIIEASILDYFASSLQPNPI
jgi:hypothetical protein